MKKKEKSIDLKKMTISKIQPDHLKTLQGGEIAPSIEPLKDYLISWLIACG
ncbi:hypothetical protein [Dokdonia sp.]|uniref:hypothetical protein n=1 Tax=Dokdonia sp. TaxID=2024995 RepID=UPI0032651DDF